MTTFDKEWQDGDDSAMEDSAWQDGRLSMHADMRLMYNDLRSALWEEMEVHEEPSLLLVESVHNWSVRLHSMGILDAEQYEDAQELLAEAGARTEME
jgi:hypothetical protein